MHAIMDIDTSTFQSRGSSVNIETRLRVGLPGFYPRQRPVFFLLTTASRQALGPTQPPVQGVPVVLSPGVKLPGRKSDNKSSSSIEVKNAWSYTSIIPYVIMAWCFVKHRDNVTFTFERYGIWHTFLSSVQIIFRIGISVTGVRARIMEFQVLDLINW
jgi:hypothetical protein